jgi:hypothetical protein
MTPDDKAVDPVTAADEDAKATAAASTASAGEKSPEEIRAEIEQTRQELGETVADLAAKTDVKAQAQAKVDDVKAEASAKADEAKAKAEELRDMAIAAAPESPQEGVQQAQALAKQNPKPLAIAGAIIGLFLLWRLLKS